jgi:DNA-binding NarL/FixJ family response regulator
MEIPTLARYILAPQMAKFRCEMNPEPAMSIQSPIVKHNPSPIRILIVDDMPQVRYNLRLLLNLTGKLEVIGEAGNGLDAIQQVSMLHPDAILLDLVMPVLDGYAAASKIKSICPTCRIVALTAHDDAAARESAIQAGVDTFIVKGAPVEELVQAILEGDYS